MCVGHLKIFLVQRLFWHLICFYYLLVLPKLLAVKTPCLSSWWAVPTLCSGCCEAVTPLWAQSHDSTQAQGQRDCLSCIPVLPDKETQVHASASVVHFFVLPSTDKLDEHIGLVSEYESLFSTPDSGTDACSRIFCYSLLLPAHTSLRKLRQLMISTEGKYSQDDTRLQCMCACVRLSVEVRVSCSGVTSLLFVKSGKGTQVV